MTKIGRLVGISLVGWEMDKKYLQKNSKSTGKKQNFSENSWKTEGNEEMKLPFVPYVKRQI